MRNAVKEMTGLSLRPVPSIQDYALIGDTHGIALVSRSGTIDWCGFPHVNSPPFLLRLLDAAQGGFFHLAPAGGAVVSRRYQADSNVLETTFETRSGRLLLRDAMEVGPHGVHHLGDRPARRHRILRTLTCVQGHADVEIVLRVTPDYARKKATAVRGADAGTFQFEWEGGDVSLSASVPLEALGDTAWARVALTEGQMLAAVLGDLLELNWEARDIDRRLDRVNRYWQAWAARSRYQGPYRAAVVRSALALKLLTHEPSGAIVAAPTTSLPEVLHGSRNWDYRFCWLRDATFTLHALELLGHFDEAHDFMHWIERVWRRGSELQIMYGVNGE
ncbi:MAG: glycoside hydrolase family 15 protein, partial [Clostridia bacterium]